MDEVESDYDYYRRRAEEELAKSRETLDPGLAAKHRQLSTVYTSRALQSQRKSEAGGASGGGGEDDRS
ncbi:MAG: hypothetical protein ABWX67_03120 [Allosphingosinicella sp.]